MTDSKPVKRRKTKKWRAVVGLTLGDGTRIEPGEVVPDPLEWMVEQGKVVKK